MKKNHTLWMMLACAIPLLIIFLLPVFRIKSDYIVFIAIVLMFGAHLFMMGGHRHDHDEEQEDKKGKSRGEKHEHH